ncbi:MAG: hypothetical protein ACKOUM_05200, partial [Sphingopyxis sp.]
AQIGAAVRAIAPGMAFGALAAGTDIVAAEAALAVGAELHIILPASTALFRQGSVAPLGANWAGRFDALLAAATTVEMLNEPGGLTDAAVRMADDMAMGLAVMEAQMSDGEPVMLRARRAGAGDAPLLLAPHHLVPVDLADNGARTVSPLLGATDPVFIRLDRADHRDDAAVAAVVALHRRLQPGDVVDLVVPDTSTQSGGDSPRLSTLAGLDRGERILVTRPAALVMLAQCAGCRPVLAGSRAGPDEAIEIYELIND